MAKYEIPTTEDEFEPGSKGAVLKNRLGIVTLGDINEAETELLKKLYEHVIIDTDYAELTVTDITSWHKKWLGNVYDWAGEYRTVNMSKGGFQFAASQQIPRLLEQYQREFLSLYSDLAGYKRAEFVAFLAKSHVEFILIHPYREGNGRLSRLLMDMLSVQAGFNVLDYEIWDKNKDFYFKSIQAGASGDYQYIERLVDDVLN